VFVFATGSHSEEEDMAVAREKEGAAEVPRLGKLEQKTSRRDQESKQGLVSTKANSELGRRGNTDVTNDTSHRPHCDHHSDISRFGLKVSPSSSPINLYVKHPTSILVRILV
jgi:hypothetical protein